MSFSHIQEFEEQLALYTGAKWAVMTDTCTNALELCFRYDEVKECQFSAYTYLSIYQLLHRLDISYTLTEEVWRGQYHFENTRIWDSARLLKKNMYQPGQLQCLSFGYDKPLYLGWGGAILTDDPAFYKHTIQQRYDGRNLSVTPWETEILPRIACHMRPTPEIALDGLERLRTGDISKLPPKAADELYPNGKDIKWK